MVFILLAIAALGLTGAGGTSDDVVQENGFPNLDARLQRFLRTPIAGLRKLEKSLSLHVPQEGEPTVEVLIQVAGDVDTLLLPGVTPRTRIGDVVTATATRSGLRALADREGIVYVEPSIRLKRRNDIGTASSSAFSGTLTTVGEADLYEFNAQAGQSLTVSMHAVPGSVLDPFLAICQDQNCATVLAFDDDSGPGLDAQLTFTFPSTGTFFIEASDSNDTSTGDYKFVLHDNPSGDFLLGIGAKALHASGKEGQGVIVGVIDSGIDWCHGDFIDDATGQSRILFLWDQNLTAQAGESAADVGSDGNASNDYGVEYTQSQINTALADCGTADPNSRRVRSADTGGHGTHVAGTAAGDGSATNGMEPAGKYKGAGPKADLVIVKYKGDLNGQDLSSSSNLVDGIDYIFKKAKALNKPAVINMSLGAHDGPVDGTSLLDQAVRNATGPGRIIVAAAGNEGIFPVHAQGIIATNGSDTVTVDLSNCAAPDCTEATINLWHSGGDAYTATLTAPNGQQLSAAGGATQSGTLDGVSVEISNATSAPPNGDKNILITIGGQGSAPFGWSLTLQRTANGEDGKWDAWILPDQGEVSFANHVPVNPDGSVAGTVGELASSFGAITVGAHSTKFRWDDQAGGTQEKPEAFQDFGGIARFSSRGPTRDGRVKPDITAPGDRVMSTRSADCPDPECAAANIALDGRHMIIEGTSMATPMVTGAVTLILQADATNFPRPLLKSTATRDNLTGASLPNSTWGSGKVNLVTALNALQADQSPTVSLSASPNSGNATLTTTLTAAASDPDAGDSIAEYLWDFENDGFTDAITTTNTAGKSYTAAGTYTAKVTAVDQRGKAASATTTITVSAPPAGDSGGGGGGGGGGCFIATAAYGSYLDPHVQTLRAFRDNVLLYSSWGRAFVDFYYKWSPPAARFIADRPLLKGATRLALTPVVFAVEKPRLSGGILMFVLAIVGVALFKVQRNSQRHA